MAGLGALDAKCGGDVGGEDDALARLAVDAAFFDLDAAVFECGGELLSRSATPYQPTPALTSGLSCGAALADPVVAVLWCWRQSSGSC